MSLTSQRCIHLESLGFFSCRYCPAWMMRKVMGLPIKETVVSQTYILPAFISLQVNAVWKERKGLVRLSYFSFSWELSVIACRQFCTHFLGWDHGFYMMLLLLSCQDCTVSPAKQINFKKAKTKCPHWRHRDKSYE